MHEDIMFLAKAKACCYFHLQISRRWMGDYISNAVSHRASSLTWNLFFPERHYWKIPPVWLIYVEINASNSAAALKCRWRRKGSSEHHKSLRYGFEANLKKQKSMLKLTRSNKVIVSETHASFSKECAGKLLFS